MGIHFQSKTVKWARDTDTPYDDRHPLMVREHILHSMRHHAKLLWHFMKPHSQMAEGVMAIQG